MTILTPEAQAVINAFAQQPGVTQDQVTNLQAVVNGSPALIYQLNTAVEQGDVRRIEPLAANANEEGSYDSAQRVLRLPLGSLTTPANGPFQAGFSTFVLGHELQHGLNRAEAAEAQSSFQDGLTAKAQEPTFPHDYTALAAEALASHRRNESSAEIAGWNATVGMVRGSNPDPGLGDIYDAYPAGMSSFINRTGTPPNYNYEMKPNLTLNADMSMAPTPSNLETMGQYYFDTASGLGFHGNSGYHNSYGAGIVSSIIQTERAHNPVQPGVAPNPIALNMTQLNLGESLLEQNGIYIGPNASLQQPMPYLDIGSNPPKEGQFNHTVGTHAHIRELVDPSLPIQPSGPSTQTTAPEMVAPFSDGVTNPSAPQQPKANINADIGNGEVSNPRQFSDATASQVNDLSPTPRATGALINQDAHPDYKEFQAIRGKTSAAFASGGRNLSEEELDNASAQLLRAKKEKPDVQEVNSVILSNATPRAAAGDRLFGVYEPNGPGKSPHEQVNVLTNDAINTKLAQSTQEIDALNQKQPAQKQQTDELKKEQDATQTPAPLTTGAITR